MDMTGVETNLLCKGDLIGSCPACHYTFNGVALRISAYDSSSAAENRKGARRPRVVAVRPTAG